MRIIINCFLNEDGLILEALNNLQNLLLIAFGAIFGANTRFIIYQKFQKINLNKHSIILLINTFSSFLLGFFIAIVSKFSHLSYYYQLGLFFSIGLLGSLSSFSTFIYDLYELLRELKFARAFKLLILSLTLGVLAFTFGLLLGLQ